MHFFYLDETGCSGANLNDNQEPIFVLGGVSVKDQGWKKTCDDFENILLEYFNITEIPNDFELHANQLLSPNGDGPFLGHDRDRRNQLCLDILNLLATRAHKIHFAAVDKQKLQEHHVGTEVDYFDASHPYLICFDYLVSYIDYYTNKHLGHTARAMLIIDIKDQYIHDIEDITHYRRFQTAKTKRLKWLVEFTYPVESYKNPMIQFSDIVIFCIRKFLEIEGGYRDGWPDEAKTFFKNCYEILSSRLQWQNLKFPDETRNKAALNQLMKQIAALPNTGWRARY